MLLHGMLAYLLFAGALHVDLADLRSRRAGCDPRHRRRRRHDGGRRRPDLGLARFLGIELPFIYGLLFGALIAPTDPIAVLGIMKRARTHDLQVRMTGESLFNDGVAVAIFLTTWAWRQAGRSRTVGDAAFLLIEAGGRHRAGLRLRAGPSTGCAQVSTNTGRDPADAGAGGGRVRLAEAIHVSAPIAVVVAGV